MAEWLRRLTRNQMGSTRVGSNPTHSDSYLASTRLYVQIIRRPLKICQFQLTSVL